MAGSIQVSVDIGEVQAMFERLSKIGTVETKEIRAVIRKAAMPIRRSAKSIAPVNKRIVNTLHATVRKHYQGGKFKLKAQIHAPGNLRKSISIIPGKKNKLMFYVGAAVGKSKAFSALYSKFLIMGFHPHGGKTFVQPNPFMDRAKAQSWDESISILSTGLWNIIKRESEK
jgi:hypothetical protein